MSSRKLSMLRVCDADDGTANRTPSAWMISLATFFAHGQIVFFVWVELLESAEAHTPCPEICSIATFGTVHWWSVRRHEKTPLFHGKSEKRQALSL